MKQWFVYTLCLHMEHGEMRSSDIIQADTAEQAEKAFIGKYLTIKIFTVEEWK